MSIVDFSTLTAHQRDFIYTVHAEMTGNGANVQEAGRMFRLVSRMTDAEQAIIEVARLGLKISSDDTFVTQLTESMCKRGYIVPAGDSVALTNLGQSASKLLEACQLVKHVAERAAT